MRVGSGGPKCTVDYNRPLDWCHAIRDVASASEPAEAVELPRRSVTMSSLFSAEHLECIQDDARGLAVRAGHQEDHLEVLARAADVDVHDAETELSLVLSGADINAGELRRLFSDHLRRAVGRADEVKQACVGAREQQVATRRMLVRLDADAGDGQTDARPRPAAVLVVDDAEEVRELVAEVLRRDGFVVRTAANGLEALIAAYEMQPAVILMDMTMPVLDGIAATRLIKATEAIRHAQIIAHTGNPSFPDAFVQRLFAAVLKKPTTPDTVLATVRTVASL
jgi:CheY-like chemotaxis protein